MSEEWRYSARVFSLMPHGGVGESMVVYRRSGDRAEFLTPLFRVADKSLSFSIDNGVFLKTDYGREWGGENEIDAFLQAMTDLAWERGVRPKNWNPDEREIAAVRAHLADMRKLAKVTE